MAAASAQALSSTPRGTRETEVTLLYFDDIRPGDTLRSPVYMVDRDEMVEYARRWDPVPIHVDAAVADAEVGGLTASGSYVLAVKSRLLHELPASVPIIGSAGYDEVRFHEPLRPGDEVHVVIEWLDCRASNSKPDRGVVKLRISLVNQHDVTVMSHLDTLIVRRRA
jgi:acyl dehydratase